MVVAHLFVKCKLNSLVECNKVDISLPQETHSTDDSLTEWELFVKGHWFFSSLPSPIGGIAIFFSANSSFKDIAKGYLASQTFSISKHPFTIVNVYAPNTNAERSSLFGRLDSYRAGVPPDHFLCLGGDFNCTLNPSLDRNGAEPHVSQHEISCSLRLKIQVD